MNDFRYTRPNRLPPIVKNLIIINALVFIAQIILGPKLTQYLVLYSALHPGFSPYQIATHMFAHGSLMHILFNMFGLWMFGKELENRWGPKRFLLFYLVCGVGAAFFHLLVQYLQGDYGAALGASGAIMGIFVAFAYLFPNTEMYLMFIPVPVKAKYAVIGLAALDIFGGFAGSSGIAHFAHLGGALTGFILVLIWNKTDRKRFY